MTNKVTTAIIIALLLVVVVLQFRSDNSAVPVGSASNATTFVTAATSGPMTVTTDVQILATSSARTYAIICNDSGQVVYLNLDQDAPASATRGIRLNGTGSCYEINELNLYQGAIRASSTDETASLLLISEHTGR